MQARDASQGKAVCGKFSLSGIQRVDAEAPSFLFTYTSILKVWLASWGALGGGGAARSKLVLACFAL